MAGRSELLTALLCIGWDMHNIGCETYAVITNRGQQTDWQCTDAGSNGDKLEMTGRAFGRDKYHTKGVCVFLLKDCRVSYEAQFNMVSIFPNRNNSAYVSFYNHDRKRKGKR